MASVEITDIPNDQVTDATLTSIQQDVKIIQIRLNEIPTKEEVESSFSQLDQKVNQVNQSSTFSFLGFMVGVILLNDILLCGLYIFAKTKGMLP